MLNWINKDTKTAFDLKITLTNRSDGEVGTQMNMTTSTQRALYRNTSYKGFYDVDPY